MNSVEKVPEKDVTKAPRLLKLITMLPEKCCLKTMNEKPNCRKVSSLVNRKLLSTDSIHNRVNTSNEVQNESSTYRNNKDLRNFEVDNKPGSATFKIQAGPKVNIKRSLQIQNVEPLHISPESSVNKPTNIGVYNFQHETFSEKNNENKDQLLDNQEDKVFLEEPKAEKKQMFRKSIVIKKPDGKYGPSLKNVTAKVISMESQNQSTNKLELVPQNDEEVTETDSRKSPEQCNIDNPKSKIFLSFITAVCKEVEDVKKNFETLNSNENHASENVNSSSTKAPGNDEIKNVSCKSEKLPNKAKIISNERVNLRYENILRGCKIDPISSKPLFCDSDESTEDQKIEIDNINLKQHCVLDLDQVLKRNDKIIDSIIHGTDMLLKIMSSKIKTHNDVINHEQSEESNDSVGFTHRKIENDSSFYQESDKLLDRIISNTEKLTKFTSSSSKLNDNVNNRNNITNSHSIDLSSVNVSLLSSTKNLISQKLSSSEEIKASSSAALKNQSTNELKHFSIKKYSEERKTGKEISNNYSLNKNSKNTFAEKKEKDNEKIVEEISTKILPMRHNKIDNFEIKDNIEFPNILKYHSSSPDEIESSLSKALALKSPTESIYSSNFQNINYSESYSQMKGNDFSETDVFGHIFESLRHSSATMKRFITCLFGETEARVENEIIEILRETSVHPTIINKFLSILEKRKKDLKLQMFTTNIELYLNLNCDVGESYNLRKEFKNFLEAKSKAVSLKSETDEKLSDDNLSNENEKNEQKSTTVKLDIDLRTQDKIDIRDDISLVITENKFDSIPQEKSKELILEKSNVAFFSKNSSKVDKDIDQKHVNNVKSETKENSRKNSLQLKLQDQDDSSNKTEIKTNSFSERDENSRKNSLQLKLQVQDENCNKTEIKTNSFLERDENSRKNSLQLKLQDQDEISNRSEIKTNSFSQMDENSRKNSLQLKLQFQDKSSNKTEIKTNSLSEIDENSRENSLQLKLQDQDESSNKTEIKTNSFLEIDENSRKNSLQLKLQDQDEISDKSEIKTNSFSQTNENSRKNSLQLKLQDQDEISNKSAMKTSSLSEIDESLSNNSIQLKLQVQDKSSNKSEIKTNSSSEMDENSRKNSLQLKLQDQDEISNKSAIKTNSLSEIDENLSNNSLHLKLQVQDESSNKSAIKTSSLSEMDENLSNNSLHLKLQVQDKSFYKTEIKTNSLPEMDKNSRKNSLQLYLQVQDESSNKTEIETNSFSEMDENSRKNSLQLKLQGQDESSNKTEIKKINFPEIEFIDSRPSISESSVKPDYSQNFTNSSSKSQACKSLESHVSLKLSDSFMNKKNTPFNKETIVGRCDAMEIQRKIQDLLDRDKRVTQSVEKSINTEIDYLTKATISGENVKQKSLIRGKTFIIKKTPEATLTDYNSSLSDSQVGSNLRYIKLHNLSLFKFKLLSYGIT